MQKLFSQELRFKQTDGTSYADWEEKRLGGRTSLLKDGTHGTHIDHPGTGYLLLSAKNIVNGNIQFDSSDREISETDYKQIYKNYHLQKGDVLLSVVGTIGRSCLWTNETNIAFQRSVAFFRFSEDNSQFIYQQFNTVRFQNELKRRQVVSAQPGIYLGDLSKIPLLIPSIEEQQKIADFLSSLDKKIGGVNAQIEKTQQFKKGLLQEMFV
jgi:restriction endonuclease S subunit